MAGQEATDTCNFLYHHLSCFVRRSWATHHLVERQVDVRTMMAVGGWSDYSAIGCDPSWARDVLAEAGVDGAGAVARPARDALEWVSSSHSAIPRSANANASGSESMRSWNCPTEAPILIISTRSSEAKRPGRAVDDPALSRRLGR